MVMYRRTNSGWCTNSQFLFALPLFGSRCISILWHCASDKEKHCSLVGKGGLLVGPGEAMSNHRSRHANSQLTSPPQAFHSSGWNCLHYCSKGVNAIASPVAEEDARFLVKMSTVDIWSRCDRALDLDGSGGAEQSATWRLRVSCGCSEAQCAEG